MFTMAYDIQIGDWKVGMLDRVEIHSSVELLADTATIVLPGADYNMTLDVESKISRGDKVTVCLGYAETGMTEEFTGWVQRIGTDDGSITVECEDDLFKFRVPVKDRLFEDVSLKDLLAHVIREIGGGFTVDSTYSWTYKKFVIRSATGYDILKKVQEESGADIYLTGNVLHIHAPAEKVGKDVVYDFSQNVQDCSLQYMKAEDRKVLVVVKVMMPDGTTKKYEYGSIGGDRVEVTGASSDEASIRQRGESEYKRRTFDGYEGSITAWLVPHIQAGDSAELHDREYGYKNGRYFVNSVTTSFGPDGATRKVELGFRLN